MTLLRQCYYCNQDKPYFSGAICPDCTKSFNCSIHGPNGEITCKECRDKLPQLLAACGEAISKRSGKPFNIGIISDDERLRDTLT